MEQISFYVTVSSFSIVFLSWLAFAAVFLLRGKAESSTDARREPKSLIGLGLQGVGVAAVWFFRREPLFSAFLNRQFVLNIFLQIFAVLLAVGSVWMTAAAVRELGRQWSLEARLVENHKLVTSGVYRIVRHPIYTALFGLLIAAGIAFSLWYALIVGGIIYFIGTKIRAAAEEKLLRAAFPVEYRKFSEKVPSFIPFVKI